MFGGIESKVRPLRLAFLVDPNDIRSLRKVIQINSTLWGGTYNPIIPIYKRMPKVWRDDLLPTKKAEVVIKGYIDAFDPDILVQCSKRLPQFITELGIETIKPDDIWQPLREDGDPSPKYGIGIFELLDLIYEDHFKFKPRFPLKIVLPKLPKKNQLFWASFLGDFPDYIKKSVENRYEKALDIEEPPIEFSTVQGFFAENILFSRRICQYNLEQYRQRDFTQGDCAFFMDMSKQADIIDFWNLRALGRQVIPVPKQLKDRDEIKQFVVDFLKSARWPHRYNPQIYNFASFIKSRNVNQEEMKEYAHSLGFPDENEDNGEDDQALKPYYTLQNWYPRIWDEWARDKNDTGPSDFYSENKEIDFNDVKEVVQVETLIPDFAFEFGGHSTPRCANELGFRFYGEEEHIAEVFPKNMGENLLRTISYLPTLKPEWRVGRNGLVRLVEHPRSERWHLPLSQEVFFGWLKDLGWDVQLSDPGRICKQIFSQLEGAVRSFANKELLKLLEYMNGGSENNKGHQDGESENRRERQTGEIIKRLEKFSKRSNLHDFLISKNVFRVGAKVQCPHCLRRSWYSLAGLEEQLSCPLCLNVFPAIGNIGNNLWYYRTAGPFSIPGYADGAYCVLLSVEFFSQYHLHNIRVTPTYCFTAKDKDGNEFEADFGILWQESFHGSVAEGVVFGECKTFDTFKKKDFQRMRKLADKFPGAVLAFCTLRSELSENEIREISRIAKTGRKYWKDERPINPVLILTGNELLSDMGPPYCWKKVDPSNRFERVHGLLEICEATQQIYLGLSSWQEYWMEQREKRWKVKKRKTEVAKKIKK
jgi:hypothetical protein